MSRAVRVNARLEIPWSELSFAASRASMLGALESFTLHKPQTQPFEIKRAKTAEGQDVLRTGDQWFRSWHVRTPGFAD